MRKTLTLRPTSRTALKLGVLLAAVVVAFVIGIVFGGDQGSGDERPAERASDAAAEGVLSLPDFGLTMGIPSEWRGEDSTISGPAIHFEKAAGWTVHAYSRREGIQTRLAEGPTLIVQVVTADTAAGRTALSDYFEMMSSLAADKPTDAYDLVSNASARMTGAGQGPASTIVVKSESTVAGSPFASEAYFTMKHDRLYVIAYARSSLREIAVDEPLVKEIMSSVSIAD